MRIAYLIFLFGVILVIGCSNVDELDLEDANPPEDEYYNSMINVSEFNSIDSKEGNYSIEGFIAYEHRCPPCPEGSLCKECMPDNFILSDSQEYDSSYDGMSDSEVIVYIGHDTSNLEVGKKYMLIVDITDYGDVELLEHRELS
ncbi:hypothetical protein H6503_05410 [Candidatus Woesearchaeota archaeon]|nr:hypothetical protein [Candidatus Woesearchaeota archaeon]